MSVLEKPKQRSPGTQSKDPQPRNWVSGGFIMSVTIGLCVKTWARIVHIGNEEKSVQMWWVNGMQVPEG